MGNNDGNSAGVITMQFVNLTLIQTLLLILTRSRNKIHIHRANVVGGTMEQKSLLTKFCRLNGLQK